MIKMVLGLMAAVLFSSSVLLANGKINKTHLKLAGRDKAKIDCVYCHKSSGANIPKKRGQEIKDLYKTSYCAGHGCHK